MVKQAKKGKSKETKELEERLKRVLADYENLERRSLREIEERTKLANEKMLIMLIPVLDNLEKAQDHMKDEGITMIAKQFKQILESYGVSEVSLKGHFDPETCEAIEIVQGNDDGRIAQVLEKGYSLNGKVIRTAKVKVFKKDLDEEGEKAEKASTFGDYA